MPRDLERRKQSRRFRAFISQHMSYSSGNIQLERVALLLVFFFVFVFYVLVLRDSFAVVVGVSP